MGGVKAEKFYDLIPLGTQVIITSSNKVISGLGVI